MSKAVIITGIMRSLFNLFIWIEIVNNTYGLFGVSRFLRRHIALKFLYLGWDYQGYCIQEDNENTIEAALFDALTRTKLIEKRETSNYHRCGRTDKGVSAFSQVREKKQTCVDRIKHFNMTIILIGDND